MAKEKKKKQKKVRLGPDLVCPLISCMVINGERQIIDFCHESNMWCLSVMIL